MKNRAQFIFACLLTLVSLISLASADGFIHIYDKDMWRLGYEDKQFCAINYRSGIEQMILTIDTPELEGEKAVWIFPVPSDPNFVHIDILRGFPFLNGYDVLEKVDDSISNYFDVMRASQVYTWPIYLFRTKVYSTSGKGGIADDLGIRTQSEQGWITFYEMIDKMGIRTQVITATDKETLSNYMKEIGLNLTSESEDILGDYIGQNYSFVVSYIPNITQFKDSQKNITGYDREYRYPPRKGNVLGVYINFPTDRIYFPLKPTSVYGEKRVPAIIYVMDYAEPEIFDSIKNDVQLNYYFSRAQTTSSEFQNFFEGQDMISDPKYSRVNNLKYTKISINTTSSSLTDDLWIDVSTPKKVALADKINNGPVWYVLITFMVLSCAASLISGAIVYRKESPSFWKFVVLGLANFLSFIAIIIFSYSLNITKRFSSSKYVPSNPKPFSKIMIRTALWSLILPGLIWIMFISQWAQHPLYFMDFIQALFVMAIVYLAVGIFLAPSIYGWYNNRKVFKFTLIFTVTFVLLTIILQKILTSVF